MTTDTPSHDLRSALEPCPFCGETPYWANGGPGNHVVICSGCGASSDDGSRERIAEKWNRRALASDVISNGGGWIVSNGAGDRWRTWNRGWSEWTAMRDHATRYARREDAEAVHAGDEEAWRVEPFVHHPAAEPVGLREALKRAASDMTITPRHNRGGVADKHIRESRERIRQALATPARTDDAAQAGGGAAAMREAAAKVAIAAGYRKVELGFSGDQCFSIAKDIRALPIPTQEVEPAATCNDRLQVGAGVKDGLASDDAIVRAASAELAALASLIERPPHDDVELELALATRIAASIRIVLATQAACPTGAGEGLDILASIPAKFDPRDAKRWWAGNMTESQFVSARLSGDGYVKFHWKDADESGDYSVPWTRIALWLAALTPADARKGEG